MSKLNWGGRIALPLLRDGSAYVVRADDETLPITDRQLLVDLDMAVCVGVPVVVENRIWGLLDAGSERIASPGREKHFVKVPHGHARFTGDSVAISAG